jgi:uncharacterized protein (TIGR03435 family)
MARAIATLSIVALLSGAAFGQSAESTPKFDLADVHVSPKSNTTYMSGGVLRGGRYEIRRATMVDLIRTAWSLDNSDKIQGGPNWLDLDRFDVIAKAPPSTTQEGAKLMLQALLADRFKLVVHTDSKPMAGLILSLGKGKPKLKESEGKGAGCQAPPNQAPPQPGLVTKFTISCHNMTMEAFAPILRNIAGGTKPVVDKTDLAGAWDFDFTFTPQQLLGLAGADGIPVFDAVDKQLGLKLEEQKIPMQVIVVDSANEKPIDNPADVTTALPPPPPAEFEVADIKPSQPGANMGGQGLMPGGRIELIAVQLKMLIQLAWNINNPDEMLVGAPKFLDAARFDVIAKASSINAGPASSGQLDIDALRVMFQALLIDRFKMKVHYEDRPVSSYELTVGKPKLQKADPANRTGCHEGPGADGKDPRTATPVLSRLLTCQNMTIAQLAEQLPNLANGYVHTPVLDSTGLTDHYDFTLSFSAINVLQNGVPTQQPGEGAANASDPSGGLSLPDAMNKQLGIKMELRKRPMQVLVIDHVEEKPTDN